MIKGKVDTLRLRGRLKLLRREFEGASMHAFARLVAMALIQKSQSSPIPSDTHDLSRHATIQDGPKPGHVRFGFNLAYAAFQDQPNQKSGHVKVVPRKKKWLFVPLTQRARRRHRPGGNPEHEGLTFGGFVRLVGGGRRPRKPPKASKRPRKVRGFGSKKPKPKITNPDYILAKEVRIPIKPYRNRKGPNHYFSETIRRYWKIAMEQAATVLRKQLKAAAGAGGNPS